MIEPGTVFGISMERRRNRRALVCMTYAIYVTVTLVLATIAAIRRTRVDVLSVAMPIFTLSWSIIACYIFGRIASPFLMSPWFRRPPETVDRGLGLSASVPTEIPQPDERELGIRNSAYYYAYQIFLAASFVGLLLFGIGQHLGGNLENSVDFFVVMTLIVAAPTLPQAVVLWREQDVSADV